MTDGALTIPIVAGLAVGGVVAQATEGLPAGLQQLSTAGSAVLVIAVMWFWMKHAREVSKEHGETTKAITAEFSRTTKENSEKFAETTTNLMETTAVLVREARAEAQQREERLAQREDRILKAMEQFTHGKS